MDEEISEKLILDWAQQMYPGKDFKSLSQRYRPKICPFSNILKSFPKSAVVLDVGCGSGLLLGLLASAGRISKGIGFDADQNVVQLAIEMTNKSGFEDILSFQHIGVESPWPRESINTVSMVDVMHHIPKKQRRACIEKVSDSLPTGGIFVYKDMSDTPAWKALGNRMHDLLLARDWISYSKMQDIITTCEEFGLRVRHQNSWSELWYAHELSVFEKL